jgi:hypothetical protein
MMIKFFNQGKSDGRAIADYLLSEEKHKRYKPEIVRGSEYITRQTILSITNENKYSTGVISFSQGEEISHEKQLALMNDFERTFCPFDDPARINFLWVRHFDKGRLELHFLTPKQDLKTGKAFNIHPPGKANISFFNNFVACKNYEFGFSQVDKKYCSKENYLSKVKFVNDLCSERIKFIVDRYDKKIIKKGASNGKRRNNNTKHSKSSHSTTSDRQSSSFVGIGFKSNANTSNQLEQFLLSSSATSGRLGISNIRDQKNYAKPREGIGRDDERSKCGKPRLEKTGMTISSVESQLAYLYAELAISDNKQYIIDQINTLLVSMQSSKNSKNM